jgi:hypothetical protein
VLSLLQKLGLHVTFFVVGADAVRTENLSALRSIAEAGHEIGNHSFHHEPWLHLYSREQLVAEFETSESAILGATGQKTIGFRGPGFSYSQDVLELLCSRGYEYDASTFPTFLGPIARAYYFMHSHLNRSDREKRNHLFGDWNAGFGPLRPYRMAFGQSSILEIPVTTMPWLKVPFHLSYVMYLATFSRVLATMYFRMALRLCWLHGVEPSLLLHPLDFLGRDDVSALSFFPGMSMNHPPKLAMAEKLLGWMSKRFECLTMVEHARRVNQKLEAVGQRS